MRVVQRRRGSFLMGFILFLIVGVVFSLIGGYMLSGNMKMVKTGVLTEGTVVEINQNISTTNNKRSVTYSPVIEYLTFTGETIRTEYSAGGSNPNKYKIGQKLSIYYSTSNPNDILIDSFMEKYGFPSIFVMAGVIGFIMAIVLTVRKIRYGVV